MIRTMLKLMLMGLVALIMPLLVHAEEIESKEETKIEQKEDISIVKSVNPDNPTESCLNYDYNKNNLPIEYENYRLGNNGELIQSNGWNVSPRIKLNKDKTYTLIVRSNWSSPRQCTFDEFGNKLDCYSVPQNTTQTITIINASYIQLSFSKENTFDITFTGDYCVNMEEETMVATKNIEKLLIIGVGILIAIFLTRRY